MMNDLRQAISKLRALSPQLNAAVLDADRVVLLVERFLLEECGLGVEAEVPLQYNDKGKVITLLRYANVNGQCRIALTNTDGSTHFVTRPWIECDRNERMTSFSALPKLLMAITKTVEQQIASTNSTASTVGQIMSALGMSAGAPLPNVIDSEPELTLLMGDPAGTEAATRTVRFSDLVPGATDSNDEQPAPEPAVAHPGKNGANNGKSVAHPAARAVAVK